MVAPCGRDEQVCRRAGVTGGHVGHAGLCQVFDNLQAELLVGDRRISPGPQVRGEGVQFERHVGGRPPDRERPAVYLVLDGAHVLEPGGERFACHARAGWDGGDHAVTGLRDWRTAMTSPTTAAVTRSFPTI